MATFNKIQDFVEQLGLARHNLNTATLKVALNRSDAAAGAGAAVQATDTILADIVQPTGTGYTAGGIDTQNTWAETGGTATLTGTKCVWTAGAGDWQSFRYVVLFNDDTTTPTDQLIGWWDYGSDLTLANGETFSVKFNNSETTGSILTLA
jgi:hypothetical protein